MLPHQNPKNFDEVTFFKSGWNADSANLFAVRLFRVMRIIDVFLNNS